MIALPTRVTRSKTKQLINQSQVTSNNKADIQQRAGNAGHREKPPKILSLAHTLSSNTTGLCNEDVNLLNQKRTKLRRDQDCLAQDIRNIMGLEPEPAEVLLQAASATLVFAQEEAGTAICIAADGLLLTCSHCIAEEESDPNCEEPKWLLFASGLVVQARCVAFDRKRDLALLQITAAESTNSSPSSAGNAPQEFPFARIATKPPVLSAPLVCVGHPGSEDLEASRPGVKTGYDVLHVSAGKYRGLAHRQDVHDNSEIGALKHDCWTYWGHSGAPLFEQSTGLLVGLHSSWDDRTGMRRGINLDAVRAFLEINAAEFASRMLGVVGDTSYVREEYCGQ